MSTPKAVAVMLTRNRPQMAARAIRSFLKQDYENKELLIWNTGGPIDLPVANVGPPVSITEVMSTNANITFGALRNAANAQAEGDIIVHWDDDDWSAPHRMTLQVNYLKASPALDACGLNRMLFWREPHLNQHQDGLLTPQGGEAWMYQNTADPHYAVGTSLCYWRSSWVQVPFNADIKEKQANPRGVGEDRDWIRKVRVAGLAEHSQMMIAALHPGGTAQSFDPTSTSWMRVTHHDAFCQERMQL